MCHGTADLHRSDGHQSSGAGDGEADRDRAPSKFHVYTAIANRDENRLRKKSTYQPAIDKPCTVTRGKITGSIFLPASPDRLVMNAWSQPTSPTGRRPPQCCRTIARRSFEPRARLARYAPQWSSQLLCANGSRPQDRAILDANLGRFGGLRRGTRKDPDTRPRPTILFPVYCLQETGIRCTRWAACKANEATGFESSPDAVIA